MQQEFLKDLIGRLEALSVLYAITGSIASNLWGSARTTHDVDIVVVLSIDDVPRLTAAFADRYYVDEPAVTQAVSRRSMFNVVDYSTSLKGDFWVTKDDPFNASMLRRRRRLDIIPGQQAWVGTPEDILLHKLVWNRITPSERQLADAAGIAEAQAGVMDLAYLRDWATRQGTADVLEAVPRGEYAKKT